MRSDVLNMHLEGEGFREGEIVELESNNNDGEMGRGHKGKYTLKESYPEVKVECKNKHYAAILSNDFAGAVSEMTAVSQYVNHHIKIESMNKEIGEALLAIGIVEMYHLEMIGEVILKLGGEPYYGRVKKDKFQCWSPRFIVYGKDIKGMLKADIQGEVDAIAQYKKHIEEINDKHIKKLLERIIKDEEHHIEILDKLLKKC